MKNKKNRVKIIANYLPQYHRIPENDRWWGEGFTDWTAVKGSLPLYQGHAQPKIPLGGRYYQLDRPEAVRWQASLAKKYGIYGFGIYHYWFSSSLQLLQKPAEILLENKDIDMHFLFIWDNLTWKRTWSRLRRGLDWAPSYDGTSGSIEQGNREPGSGRTHFYSIEGADTAEKTKDAGILARLDYGNETDWAKHYEYLSAFFKDDRYIKEKNRPVFCIFQPRNDIRTLKKMTACWNELAKQDGFDGILMVSKDSIWPQRLEKKMKYAPFAPSSLPVFAKYKLKEYLAKRQGRIDFYTYDACWQNLLREARKARGDTWLCGFVSYDDTPRRGTRAKVVTGGSPRKFEKYMTQLLKLSTIQHKEYVFLMAWNEWGEGAYLEPDEENHYEYLDALKRAVLKADS